MRDALRRERDSARNQAEDLRALMEQFTAERDAAVARVSDLTDEVLALRNELQARHNRATELTEQLIAAQDQVAALERTVQTERDLRKVARDALSGAAGRLDDITGALTRAAGVASPEDAL